MSSHHHNILPLFLLSTLLLLCSKSSMGAEHGIKTPAEFTEFLNDVNINGEGYSGTTVYLDSDLSLSGVTDPIGKSNSSYFLGVFDGQGHTISNFNINSTTEYAGLFGYSTGLTIRNVVLDESCSILGSFIDNSSDAYTYVAGFVGNCIASAGSCAIENNVNMGSVTLNGVNRQLHLAGIAGKLGSSASYVSYVRNCVNYGSVTHSGTNKRTSNLGGIVGALGDTNQYKYIQNCANYGTIMHSGTTSSLLRIAGIVGYSKYGYIENCLNAGKISLSNEPSSIYKGSLVGYINLPTNISYCYFTNDVNVSDLYGPGGGSPIISNTPNSASTVNPTLLSSLNTQATNKGWNNWVSLHLNGGMVNYLTQDTLVVTGKPFPNPMKEGDTFIHWCKDENCDSVYDPQADGISGITDLYAHWTLNNYTVAFVFDNGAENEVRTLSYNEAIVYPADPTKEGHTFNGWSPKPERMPTRNITVTAQWIEKPSEYVEIVFGKKDLKEEDVREILQAYTQEEFVIEKIEEGEETGDVRVIVKFIDQAKADSFVERIRESSEFGNGQIKTVAFIYDPVESFSLLITPFLLLVLLTL